MSTGSGGTVSGSTARYYPFGNWRTEPTAGLTDMGYTGHRHNNLGNAPDDIGLIYMNARWYLPGLGRFISADTLVPNPTNPQNWNRYSYTNNNPIRFSDPSGHCAAEGASGGGQCTPIPPPPASSPSPANPMPTIPNAPIVSFAGEDWTTPEQDTINASAVVTGTALAGTLNAEHGWNLTPEEAFLLVYGGTVTFTKTGQSCLEATGYSGCWGRSTGRNSIEVFTDIVNADGYNMLVGDEHWAVHELGHSFVNATGGGSPNTKYEAFQRRFGYPDRGEGGNCINIECGFASGPYEWQRSLYGDTREEFADMYLGWVYGQWENAPAGLQRGKHMNFTMPVYIEMAINNR